MGGQGKRVTMTDDELAVIDETQVKQQFWYRPQNHWRVIIKSNDGIDMANEDFVTGGYDEAVHRCITLARRASYVPDAPNRVVYACVERWDEKRQVWVKLWERKSKVPDRFHHAQLARVLKS
jgi:hypothetical protein